jgi:hypothetical protein
MLCFILELEFIHVMLQFNHGDQLSRALYPCILWFTFIDGRIWYLKDPINQYGSAETLMPLIFPLKNCLAHKNR